MSTQRMFLRSVGTPFQVAGMRAGLVVLAVIAGLLLGLTGVAMAQSVPGYTVTTFASIPEARGVSTDAAGNVYTLRMNQGMVHKISPAGVVSLVADLPDIGFGYDGPHFDPVSGNLFVGRFANNSGTQVLQITSAGVVSVFASGIPAPGGITSDAAGNLYVTSWTLTGYIYKVTPGGAVSLFATGLSYPDGLVFGPGGDLFVGNRGTHQILRVPAGGGTATVFASGFNNPLGITYDGQGNLYVANFGNGVLSKVSPTGAVSTFGTGFSQPVGLAFDSNGNLFVANFGNGTISKIAAVSPPANQPPVANAGSDQTVECTGPSGGSVTLNGTGSSDPDGDALTYSWSGSFGTASGPTPTVTLPLGTHTITLTVNDGKGGTATDQVTITVQDTTPPTISLTVSPTSLWPPNHKMVKLATSISATDICDPSPTVSIAVTSNEPENGLGDGDTAPDWEVVNNEVSVRAERSGKGTGRIYTITVTATDASGNTATSTKTVTVAHDKGKSSKPVAEEPAPEAFGLEQSYPNPFNPATTIRYALPEGANVTLVVYNILGQQVKTLVNTAQGPGYHTAVWDGRDEAGRMAATGVYIYRLQAGAFVQVKKMLFAK